MTWFWTTLLGVALLVGGFLAVIFSATRVVLPYDEALSAWLRRINFTPSNPDCSLFMAHDRVTLAGTLFAVGVFYLALSWFAIRNGVHWAKVTVLRPPSRDFSVSSCSWDLVISIRFTPSSRPSCFNSS